MGKAPFTGPCPLRISLQEGSGQSGICSARVLTNTLFSVMVFNDVALRKQTTVYRFRLFGLKQSATHKTIILVRDRAAW